MKETIYATGTGEDTTPNGMTIDWSNGKEYSVTFEINASGELVSVNPYQDINKERKHTHGGLKK